MKRVKGLRGLVFVGLLALILALAACGGTQSGGTSEPGTNAAGQEQKSGEENKEPQQKEEQKELQTVRFSEVIRSIFYAPNYVALEQGFFEEEGLKVDMVTSQGSDKGAAALLAGTADISLIGPETTIYINKEKGAKKIKVFYQLTATDGSFLLSRNKIDNFDWSQLNGEKIISWRPGSAPQMVMASVLKKNNVEAELITNIAAPAMVGAYSSGQADFIQVYEPVASMLEDSGQAHLVASLGRAMGAYPETSYVATEEYIAENPDVIQKWSNAVYKARLWMEEQTPEEVAEVLQPYFEGTDKKLIAMSVERYLGQYTWPKDPTLTKEQYDLLEKTLLENGVIKEEERVNYEDAVDTTFSKKAMQ